jgi:hypothetical protein
MPVFKSGQGFAPEWCEMQYFETQLVPVGGTYSFNQIGPREKLIVAQGNRRQDREFLFRDLKRGGRKG